MWIDSEGFIQTTLYEKPCRVVLYLLPSLCHPGFISKNIPYSLAYRLVRIESMREGLDRNLQKLTQELVERGYNEKSVKDAVARARLLTRDTVLKKLPRPENKRPVLCLPYDPRLPNVTALLKN